MSALPVPAPSRFRLGSPADLFESIARGLQLNARGRSTLRAVFGVILATVVLALAAALATLPGLLGETLATGAASPAQGQQIEYVTVGQGDSLWSIASGVAAGEDPRDVMLAIAELNALDSTQLHPGQRLAVPAVD